MDHKVDALSNRLQGRHLTDELLGLLRGNGRAARVKNEIMDTAGSAIHSAVDTIKAHPMPALFIGAGLAWLVYEARHNDGNGHDGTGALERGAQKAREKAADLKECVAGQSGELKERVKEAAENVQERASEGASRVRESAARVGTRVTEGAQNVARRAGQQVARTAREHPLETGLSCFAIGLTGALLLPTPDRLREAVEPAGERVRDAGRDLVQRGKRVAEAAVSAAKDAAEEEGLMPEARDVTRPSSESESIEEGRQWDPRGPQSPAPDVSRT
jgi:gas vesicle protein